MAAWMVAARQAASVTASRISSKTVSSSANQASKLIQRRGLAGGGGKNHKNQIPPFTYFVNQLYQNRTVFIVVRS